MKQFLLILCLLIGLSIQANLKFDFQQLLNESPVSFPSKDGVMILTSETIDEAIKTYPRLVILFFAPWCPHCKSFYPEMALAAQSQEMEKMKVKFAKLDVDYHTSIAEKFQISGMPTIFFFNNGEKIDYDGGRDKDSIIEWFYKKLISKTHPIKSLEDIKQYEKPKKHRFIYFGEDKEKIEKYETFAMEKNSYLFGLCKDKKLIKSYGIVEPETVVIYKPFDEPPYATLQNITVESLNELLSSHIIPLIWDNVHELLSYLFQRRRPAVLFFRNQKDKKTVEFDKNFKNLAEKFRGKLLFSTVDLSAPEGTRILNISNATKYNAETNEPTALIFDFNKKFNSWLLEKFFDKYTNENLAQFIQDWVDGKIKPPITSEEIPEKQDGPVYKLVYYTFKKEVLENDLNVLVKFYSPNCPHCKKMAGAYVELAERLKDNKKIRIAEYNMKDNDFELFKISGFPTIILFKAGDKDNRIKYKGDRSVEDMMSFVLTNIGESETKKKPDEL